MSDDPTEFLLRFQQLTQRTHEAATASTQEAKRLNQDSQRLLREVRNLLEEMQRRIGALEPPPPLSPPHWALARSWWLVLAAAVPLSLIAGTLVAAHVAAGATDLTTFGVWWRIFVN